MIQSSLSSSFAFKSTGTKLNNSVSAIVALVQRGDNATLVHDVGSLCRALDQFDILLDDEHADRPPLRPESARNSPISCTIDGCTPSLGSSSRKQLADRRLSARAIASISCCPPDKRAAALRHALPQKGEIAQTSSRSVESSRLPDG